MYRNRKNYIKPAGWILFLLCFYAAASFTGCDPALFISRSSHLSDLAADMLRPDLSYFPKILLPLFYTVQMSVTGTVTGSALALIVSPFGEGSREGSESEEKGCGECQDQRRKRPEYLDQETQKTPCP